MAAGLAGRDVGRSRVTTSLTFLAEMRTDLLIHLKRRFTSSLFDTYYEPGGQIPRIESLQSTKPTFTPTKTLLSMQASAWSAMVNASSDF
jgi:hypothetical protein